ncbi:hypothetical protein [Merismopedia glauca]|uniref:DUF2281 domain-containing protein n=1 Tax=Merismopedia glauca CCAP 1448/3 TaxID=1296344 RepID=A0A2T1C684_9CYAN|nr:hypothetical protein [Merismopedia glauca]PSB03771.1 hypothetical protein C7B64_07095 [Merismopedia glauca CCAP 1448/3]
MSPEQDLLTKWRSLSPNKQEEVLDFVEFLYLKNSADRASLGKRLRQLRAEIVASGEPLLTRDEVEREIAHRRGGLQETDS